MAKSGLQRTKPENPTGNHRNPPEQLLSAPVIRITSRNESDPAIEVENTRDYNIIEVFNDMGKVTLIIEDTCVMVNSRAALAVHPMGNSSFQLRKSKEQS